MREKVGTIYCYECDKLSTRGGESEKMKARELVRLIEKFSDPEAEMLIQTPTGEKFWVENVIEYIVSSSTPTDSSVIRLMLISAKHEIPR